MLKLQDKPDSNNNSLFLQGSLYDGNYKRYREIWETYTKDKDKDQFCNAVYANIFVFSPSGLQYFADTISEFKGKINQSIYDDRTLELALYLNDIMRFTLESQFANTESKYIENVRSEVKSYIKNERIPKLFHRIFQAILVLSATSFTIYIKF